MGPTLKAMLATLLWQVGDDFFMDTHGFSDLLYWPGVLLGAAGIYLLLRAGYDLAYLEMENR